MSKSKSKSKQHKKRPERIPKILYHYTSVENYEMIVATGYLELTPSNLRPCNELRFRIQPLYREVEDADGSKRRECYDYELWDETYDYKPVVWLTDDPDATPNSLCVPLHKFQVRLSIDTTGLPCRKWRRFAEENHMNKVMQRQFEAGHRAASWFVCTSTIPFNRIVDVAVDSMLLDDEDVSECATSA